MSNSEDLYSLCSSRDTYIDPSVYFPVNQILSIYRNRNILKYQLEKNNINYTDYLISLVPFLIPGIVLAFLVIVRVLWSIFLILRRKEMICVKYLTYLDTLFYSEKKKKNFLVVAGIITFLTLGSIGAGIAFSVKMMNKTDDTYCSYYQALNKVNIGDETNNWFGLSAGAERVAGVNSKVTDTANQMSTNTGGSSSFVRNYAPLNTKSSALVNKFENVYTTRNADTITMPYFSTPEAAYNPLLFKSLGPTSDATTKLGAAVSTTQDITTNIISYNTNVDTETTNYISSASSYATKTSVVDQAFQDMIDWYYNFNANGEATLRFSTIRSDFKAIAITILALFSFSGLGNVIILLLLRYIYIDKVIKEAKAYGCLTFFNLTLLLLFSGLIAIIYPLTIMNVEACDISNTAGNNATFFKEQLTYFPGVTSDSLEFFSYCIHDTGDLITKYELEPFLSNYENYLTNANGVITKGSSAMDETSNLVTEANLYRYFYYQADQYDTSRSVKISDKLLELNTLSNFLEQDSAQVSSAKCRVLADMWELSVSQCPYGIAILSGGAEAYLNVGKKTCLGVNEVTSQGIIDRHADYKFTGCRPMSGSGYTSGELQTNLVTYLNNFVTHTQSVQNTFGNLVTDLTNIQSNELQDYRTQVSAVKDPVQTLKTSTQTMTDYVMPDGGTSFRKGLNCSSIRSEFFQVNNNVCAGLTYSTQIVAILGPVTFLLIAIQTFIYSKLLIVSL